jgi:FixJ family two-component response regulator
MAAPERAEGTIYIVDDEEAVRDALGVVLTMEGYRVEGFGDGESFLAATRRTTPAAVFLDVHMPGRTGLEVLGALSAQTYDAPIFVISGQGDIPMAVQAIKDGAFDFIEKPFDADVILERVREAIAAFERRRAKGGAGLGASFPGSDLLTPREREVLQQIASGASNKEAGRTLGISPRTIEVHRARIMEKLGAKNAADLVRIVLT